MSSSAKRHPLQKERSFDSSNGRPTKYFKLDRTYSDVVEDELYDPQPEATETPQTSSPAPKNPQSRTERIQNAYPQLFHGSGSQTSDIQSKTDHYWPGMESSIRFDRDQRNGHGARSQVIADQKQKLSQQPEQSTVSPKEAFLDYSENANFDNKGSVFEYSNTRLSPREQSDVKSTDNLIHSGRTSQFPTMSSQQNFGKMSAPKTITPVRANEKSSPKPVARGQVTQHDAIRPSSGPTKAQAHDNAAANAKIRALYKEESTTSNLSGGSDMQSPTSLHESEGDYMPFDTSQSSAPGPGNFPCTECNESFDRASALELHSRIHARPPAKLREVMHHQDASYSDAEEGEEVDSDSNSHDKRLKMGGPHRCDWIIPSTGQVCGTVFSRPYDLVRHQDTIHRAKKLEFRCEICIAAGTQKIFSRNDALVRHMRHVHKKDPPKKQ